MASPSNDLRLAIVATICEHPSAEKYRQRAFIDSPDRLAYVLSQPVTLTKADFFALDENGKSFLDTPGAWKNFKAIERLIRLSGERLTADDLCKPYVVGTYRTPLDSARLNGAFDKLFDPEVWRGHYEEFEKVWYDVSKNERDKIAVPGVYGPSDTGHPPLQLKRILLGAEGRIPPEDRLERAGLTLANIRDAANNPETFETVKGKLQRAGDYFRREYLIAPDTVGDTVFDNREHAWDRYNEFQKILREHGERLEVRDFTRRLSNVASMLQRAHEKKALDKVFTPENWVGNLEGMVELWGHVQEGWKNGPVTPEGFDVMYAAAEDMTYTRLFAARGFTGKEDLLTPLNEAGGGRKPVLPLGLKSVWENIDAVQAKLAEREERITLSDLRAKSGQLEDSALMIAAKFNRFDKVIDIARRDRDILTMSDFAAADVHGNTLIHVLAENKQLGLVFNERLWVGRVSELRELWSLVAAPYRDQVDYNKVEVATRQLTIQSRHAGKQPLP